MTAVLLVCLYNQCADVSPALWKSAFFFFGSFTHLIHSCNGLFAEVVVSRFLHLHLFEVQNVENVCFTRSKLSLCHTGTGYSLKVKLKRTVIMLIYCIILQLENLLNLLASQSCWDYCHCCCDTVWRRDLLNDEDSFPCVTLGSCHRWICVVSWEGADISFPTLFRAV